MERLCDIDDERLHELLSSIGETAADIIEEVTGARPHVVLIVGDPGADAVAVTNCTPAEVVAVLGSLADQIEREACDGGVE